MAATEKLKKAVKPTEKTTKAAVKKTTAKTVPAKIVSEKTTAAKKPEAKTTSVKKPATKKPAAEKAAVKKTAAKTEVKTPAKVKAAGKNPAANQDVKTTAKKTQAKAAEKTSAVKTRVVKNAPLTKPAAVKKAVAKPEVNKPAVSKPTVAKPAIKSAVSKPAAESSVREVIIIDLFEAHSQNTLPRNKGVIVKSTFKENSLYTIFEIIAYTSVQEISRAENGLQFQCLKTKKLHILLEPASYFFNYIEDPFYRPKDDQIPYARKELEVLTSVDESLIMIPKEPRAAESAFTILKPGKTDFTVVFSVNSGVHKDIGAFFNVIFCEKLNISKVDAERAVEKIATAVRKALSQN